MGVAGFRELISVVTREIAGRALDTELQTVLNHAFPSTGSAFQAIAAACRTGIDEGWMCQRSAGGIRYGRILKPAPDIHQFSVDVVEMQDVVGPHHAHPNGEIDMIMPVDAAAQFDGHPCGWIVYGPGTAHRPTVTAGRAVILYLLPEGAIDFAPVGAR
jgi:hypothetical protein